LAQVPISQNSYGKKPRRKRNSQKQESMQTPEKKVSPQNQKQKRKRSEKPSESKVKRTPEKKEKQKSNAVEKKRAPEKQAKKQNNKKKKKAQKPKTEPAKASENSNKQQSSKQKKQQNKQGKKASKKKQSENDKVKKGPRKNTKKKGKGGAAKQEDAKKAVKKNQKKQTQKKAGAQKNKSQNQQKKSQKKSQLQKPKKRTKKRKKKNLRTRVLGSCRKTKSGSELVSIFSQQLVNDIRFNGKFANRISISLDLYGRIMFTTKRGVAAKTKQPAKEKVKAPKEAKKKKVDVRQEVIAACRQSRSEDDLITQFGEKVVNDIRFKGKYKSRIEISLDQFGKRLYKSKKSLKTQRRNQREIRKKQIKAAYKALADMDSVSNFDVCQNAIRECYSDWSAVDVNFLKKLHENEIFNKELVAPVLFSNLTREVKTEDIVKHVMSFGRCDLKRISNEMLVVNFKDPQSAKKCVGKFKKLVVANRTLRCATYKPK